jgi:uncharacterized membrane protein HdeD (DUF308 family)
MSAVERARRNMTLVLGALTALLGIAMIVATAARGGGPTAIGILLGAAFTVIGCARVYFAAGARSHDA